MAHKVHTIKEINRIFLVKSIANFFEPILGLFTFFRFKKVSKTMFD